MCAPPLSGVCVCVCVCVCLRACVRLRKRAFAPVRLRRGAAGRAVPLADKVILPHLPDMYCIYT